ncbi:Feruloyl esterase protein [Dioscorea alata]|nr:Feruloyl esterase protein [Dioscorea alata]
MNDSEKLAAFGGCFGDSIGRNDTQLNSYTEGTSQQRISIKNSVGENLVGILHEAGSDDLVILCHGFRSSKESKTIVNLAKALLEERFSVFCFDFAGNGESEGLFQYGNYRREVEDLRAVILYFQTQNRKVCAIAGHSKGGNVVLLYASVYNDIPRVINISGRFNLKRGIEDRLGKDYMRRIKENGFIDVKDKSGAFLYKVTEESLVDRLTTDMLTACHSIDQKCKVLTVHGSDDDIVPSEDAYEFANHIVTHKLHIIEGADHEYMTHQDQLAKLVPDFVKSDLKEDDSA